MGGPCLAFGPARSLLRGDSMGSDIIVCGGGIWREDSRVLIWTFWQEVRLGFFVQEVIRDFGV